MVRGIAVAALAICIASCAPKTVATAPPLPPVLKYPEFVYPAVPQSLASSPVAGAIDRGWRFLQNDNLGASAREFSTALKGSPTFYPAQAGEGWVAVARKNHAQALMLFDAALAVDKAYVPALIGRGQTLLALARDSDALAAFEAALAIDASLVDVRRRVEVLKFRSVQDLIERARAAAGAGRLAEAASAYRRAIETSPDSAFLYRELAVLERRQGDPPAALAHFRKAVELDPSDGASWLDVGSLLEEQQDFDGALNAYRRASAVESSAELTARIAATAEKAREAALPAEFKAIRQSAQITRGDLAALIGVRLEALLRSAPVSQVVVTDVRGHWAARWITPVVNAGVIEAFENHTFQPRQRVRRLELATAVSHLLTLLMRRDPAVRARWPERPPIADMPASHLSYPAVSISVASGAMPLLEGQRFQMTRPVTGVEAIDTIERLRALAAMVR